MRRITIPGDNGDEWAEIRDRSEITNRQRQDLRAALHCAGAGLAKLEELGYEDGDIKTWGVIKDLAPEDADPMSAYRAKQILVVLIRWSLDRDIPTTVAEVDDLDGALYDALNEGIIDTPKQSDFSVDGGATDPKADTDSSLSPETSSPETSSPQGSS